MNTSSSRGPVARATRTDRGPITCRLAIAAIVLLAWAGPQALLAQPRGMMDRSPEEQQRFAQRRERYRRWAQEQEMVWQEAAEFARQYSPNRWMLYESLPDSAPAKERIRTAILRRYQLLRGLGSPGDPPYDIARERILAEDEAWALGRDIRNVGDERRRAELHEQLRQLVEEMVDRHFEERRLRIDRLKQALADEEKRLSEDRGRRDAMIERQMRQIIEDEEHLLRPSPGPNAGRVRDRDEAADQPDGDRRPPRPRRNRDAPDEPPAAMEDGPDGPRPAEARPAPPDRRDAVPPPPRPRERRRPEADDR